MYKHRQRLHRAEWEADRSKPIPPNIMKQAKQGSKVIKVKRGSGSGSSTPSHLITPMPISALTHAPHSIFNPQISMSYNMSLH